MALERWVGRFGILTTRYRSIGEGEASATVLEVFGRAESGESLCLLVHGLRPHIEVAPIGRWSSGLDVPDPLQEAAERLTTKEQVRSVHGPVLKWTDLGWKPVWSVEVLQPHMVPELRRSLSGAWSLFAADIPFANRLHLDLDLGMHVRVEAEVVDRRSEGDDEEAAARVVRAGGGGRYSVDVTLRCDAEQVAASVPFPVPLRVLSFDLETSIAHERVLCAAAVVEDLATGTRHIHDWHATNEASSKD